MEDLSPSISVSSIHRAANQGSEMGRGFSVDDYVTWNGMKRDPIFSPKILRTGAEPWRDFL
jgi:hypothetical protein